METVTDSGDDRLKRLLAGVERGEGEAFAQLYDQISNVLFATAIKMMRNPVEAQDVLQDSMLKVYSKASQFDPTKGTAIAWLLTIVRNTARDRIRSVNRRSTNLPKLIEHVEATSGIRPDGADHLCARELRGEIQVALQGLSSVERRAIHLNFFEDLTHAEVAAALGLPLGTIKSRIRRALMKLRGLNPALKGAA